MIHTTHPQSLQICPILSTVSIQQLTFYKALWPLSWACPLPPPRPLPLPLLLLPPRPLEMLAGLSPEPSAGWNAGADDVKGRVADTTAAPSLMPRIA